jgi:hypothetical protein
MRQMLKTLLVTGALAPTPWIIASGLVAAPALAQTVIDYTPTEQARAEAAVRAAGFVPLNVNWAQAGYLFVKAQKDGMLYDITVSPQGTTWASTPVELSKNPKNF